MSTSRRLHLNKPGRHLHVTSFCADFIVLFFGSSKDGFYVQFRQSLRRQCGGKQNPPLRRVCKDSGNRQCCGSVLPGREWMGDGGMKPSSAHNSCSTDLAERFWSCTLQFYSRDVVNSSDSADAYFNDKGGVLSFDRCLYLMIYLSSYPEGFELILRGWHGEGIWSRKFPRERDQPQTKEAEESGKSSRRMVCLLFSWILFKYLCIINYSSYYKKTLLQPMQN